MYNCLVKTSEGIINKFVKKHRVIVIASTIVILGAAILLIGFYVNKNNAERANITGNMPKADRRVSSDTQAGNSSTGNDSTASTKATKIETGGITISSPIAGTTVEPGVTNITGTVTSTTGGDLYYMVKSTSSGVLVDAKVQTIAAGAEGLVYSFALNFDTLPKSNDSAVIEVYLMNGTTRLGYSDVGVRI